LYAFHDPYIEWAQEQKAEWFDCDLGSSGLSLDWDWADWDIDLRAMPADGENWFGYGPLRERLAASLSVARDQVLLAPGCTGANALVMAALLRSGDRVAVETPVYSPLVNLVRGFGGEVVPVVRSPDLRRGFSAETLHKALEGCALCLITNPHNPTGRVLDRSEIREVAGICERAGATLVVDEVYREFPGREEHPSAATCCENAVITSSMTKAYGLGGLRVGWIAGPAPVVETCVAANRVLLGRGSMAGEWLVEQILSDEVRWRAVREDIGRRVQAGSALVERFMQSRPELGWTRPDRGICSLIELPPGISGTTLVDHCREEARVYMVPGEFFGATGTVRLSFGAGPEMVEEGLKRLGRVLDGLFG